MALRSEHPIRQALKELTCRACALLLPSVQFKVVAKNRLSVICDGCDSKHGGFYAWRSAQWDKPRVCTDCDLMLDASNFYSSSTVSKSVCKRCTVRKSGECGSRHRAERNEYWRKWAKANPDKMRATQGRRRVSRLGAEATLTSDQWAAILEYHDNRCAYCLLKCTSLEVDHVIAVSRGGGHTPENVVPACRTCNAKKHSRPVFVMVA